MRKITILLAVATFALALVGLRYDHTAWMWWLTLLVGMGALFAGLAPEKVGGLKRPAFTVGLALAAIWLAGRITGVHPYLNWCTLAVAVGFLVEGIAMLPKAQPLRGVSRRGAHFEDLRNV